MTSIVFFVVLWAVAAPVAAFDPNASIERAKKSLPTETYTPLTGKVARGTHRTLDDSELTGQRKQRKLERQKSYDAGDDLRR